MKKIVSPFLLTGPLLIAIMSVSAQTGTGLPQLGKNSNKDVIAAMTLEEKAKLVVGNGFRMPGHKPQGPTIGQTQDKVPVQPELHLPSPVLGSLQLLWLTAQQV